MNKAKIMIVNQNIIKKYTNITDEELLNMMQQIIIQHPNDKILMQLEHDIYTYGLLYDHQLYQSYFYNDFDDYEDGIEFGSDLWIQTVSHHQ
ncbi:MAG: hypothetical protein LUG60_09890 [Erysipelotrichaceae bacterium]|nr:hypothetical protein [Erysipelotrichaceae bacterium]